MKLGQGNSYAALGRGKKPQNPEAGICSSLKGELMPLATSVVQKWKMDRWMKRLHLV